MAPVYISSWRAAFLALNNRCLIPSCAFALCHWASASQGVCRVVSMHWGFLGCRIFNVQIGQVLGKPGKVGHPSLTPSPPVKISCIFSVPLDFLMGLGAPPLVVHSLATGRFHWLCPPGCQCSPIVSPSDVYVIQGQGSCLILWIL